jgi:RNA polymerase sigma factor (sigma-70 family)
MNDTTVLVAMLLDRLHRGDLSARQELVAVTIDRFRLLARQMLHGFQNVRRWEQTDDVLNNALIRLEKALDADIPQTPLHYFNLAALQIRRELIDLKNKYMGPQGMGAKHHTSRTGGSLAKQVDKAPGPSTLAEWGEYHGAVESLPAELKEVIGLLWYDGLTQVEAAKVLSVSLKTVSRRWIEAKMKLAEILGDN